MSGIIDLDTSTTRSVIGHSASRSAILSYHIACRRVNETNRAKVVDMAAAAVFRK
jgi:nucleoside phosphorylase